MFSHIRTSKENKEIVTKLTNKLNLGAENVIARIAFSHSLADDNVLSLERQDDSGGKEYSKSVLFGEYEDIYLGLICTKYDINRNHTDMQKFVKIHLDEGLAQINKIVIQNNSSNLFELVSNLKLAI